MLSRVVDLGRKAAGSRPDVTLAVATEDQRIADHCEEIGVDCVMTPDNCATGSDRVLEAVRTMGGGFDFIISLQGDAPFTPPEALQQMIDAYDDQTQVITPVIVCVGTSWTGCGSGKNHAF